MANQKVSINDGSETIIELYSGPTTEAETLKTLVSVEGWDSFDNVDLQFVDKLFGSGSYLVQKRLSQRNVSIEANVSNVNMMTLRASIAKKAQDFKVITITRTQGSTVETLNAYITGLDWNVVNDTEVNFTIKFSSAEAVRLSGSETIL